MPWINLGTASPPLDQWHSFLPSVNGETFRITLIPTQPGIKYKTYALIRFCWVEGGDINCTIPRKYWPSDDPQVFDQLIPTEIKANGGLVWTPQIMKKVWWRFRGGHTNDGNWQIKLEDYVST